MTPMLIAMLCTAGALALAARHARPPAFVPFPRLPNPPQYPDVVSARVAVAQDLRRIAEGGRDKAQKEAAGLRAEVDQLTRVNATLARRAREAEARVTALEEMKLPIAIEMVAKMGQAAAEEAGNGDDEGGAGASTVYRPRSPHQL